MTLTADLVQSSTWAPARPGADLNANQLTVRPLGTYEADMLELLSCLQNPCWSLLDLERQT